MPEISRFFGIVIRMFVEAGAVHHTPHFHAYYQGLSAVFSINPVELIAGEVPRPQRRLVEAWGRAAPARAAGGLGPTAGGTTSPADCPATIGR